MLEVCYCRRRQMRLMQRMAEKNRGRWRWGSGGICPHRQAISCPAAGQQGEGGQGEQAQRGGLGDGGSADQVEFAPADVAVLDVAGGLELNRVDVGDGGA